MAELGAWAARRPRHPPKTGRFGGDYSFRSDATRRPTSWHAPRRGKEDRAELALDLVVVTSDAPELEVLVVGGGASLSGAHDRCTLGTTADAVNPSLINYG